MIGPWWPTGTPIENAKVIDAIQRDEATTAGAVFIDPITERWITGLRSAGTGNAPGYIGLDGTHPTKAGHDYLARHIVADLLKHGIVAHAAIT